MGRVRASRDSRCGGRALAALCVGIVGLLVACPPPVDPPVEPTPIDPPDGPVVEVRAPLTCVPIRGDNASSVGDSATTVGLLVGLGGSPSSEIRFADAAVTHVVPPSSPLTGYGAWFELSWGALPADALPLRWRASSSRWTRYGSLSLDSQSRRRVLRPAR